MRGKSYCEQSKSLIQLMEVPKQKCVSWSDLESRYLSQESRRTKLVENSGKARRAPGRQRHRHCGRTKLVGEDYPLSPICEPIVASSV